MNILLLDKKRTKKITGKNDILFETSFKEVNDPFAHFSANDGLVWAKWEIQQFLTRFFIKPKDFVDMANYFEQKNVHQLIQFYYDFKYPFALKWYQ